MKNNRVMLVTGGTGGHIIPAIVLYEECKKNGFDPFLAVDNRFLKFTKYFSSKISYKVINSSSMQGGVLSKVLGLFKILIGFFQSYCYLRKVNPDIVIGFGGYMTVPTILAGKLLRKKIFLHEQNAVMGNANKICGRFADLILTVFPEVKNVPKKCKTEFIGNFIRKDIKARPLDINSLKNKKLNITVLGGSQGAKILSEVIPESLVNLKKNIDCEVTVYHQAREENIESVRSVYLENKIKHEVKEFFADIKDKMADSHIIISRSGASTVTDLIFAGRSAIFIPIPYSYKNHQMLNAKYIEKNNGCWIIEQKEFNSSSLEKILSSIIEKPETLRVYSSNISALKRNGLDSIFKLLKNYCAN